jgi:oxalate decarboxylase
VTSERRAFCCPEQNPKASGAFSGCCHILIGFNSRTYEAIDLSQWIAGNPANVLATIFGQRPELFATCPRHEVFLAGKDDSSK